MLKSESGYGTAEALVAISSIFMVMLIFIPFVINLVVNLEKKESDFRASRVLYEHLEEDLFAGSSENHIYRREGQVFEIIENKEEGGICIHYKDYTGKDQRFCLSKEVRG